MNPLIIWGALKKLPWKVIGITLPVLFVLFAYNCKYIPALEDAEKYKKQAKERREKLNDANTALIESNESLEVLSSQVIRTNKLAAKRAARAKLNLDDSRNIVIVDNPNDPNQWISTLPQQ
jgi:hypothetical protein